MLASPLLVGVIASGFAWIHLPLAAFWFVGYFAFFALSLWLKASRRAKWFPPVRAYTVAAAVLGLVVAVAQPRLLRWVPAFILPFGVGLWAAARRRDRELLSGLTTVVGSALMTVVAYDAGSGTDLRRAWLLALGQFLYFAGTVFYVKSAIRERRNRRFLWISVAAHAAATVIAAAFLSPALGIVFGVLTVRAAVVPRTGMTPKQLGIGEIFSTVIVAVVSLLTV